MSDPIMSVEYIESEKVWRSPCLKLEYSSLGEAIFSKLNESDPKRVVEVDHEIGTESTVDDIRRQTIIVAQNLKRLGVQKGDTVILYSQSNPGVTPITFACFAIGAPVNFFQTDFKKDVVTHNFELLDPAVIIFEEEFREKILTYLELDGLQLPKLKLTLSVDSDELFRPSANDECFQPTQIEDPTKHAAALIFTSGSSGMPKIVILSHAAMLQGQHNIEWPLGPESIICSICDIRWVVQVDYMMQAVFFNTKRVYTSRPESAITLKDRIEMIDKHKITNFLEVPKYYMEILALLEQSKGTKSLTSLKFAVVCGDVVTEALVEYSKRVLPNCEVIKCYGMSELSGPVCTNELNDKFNLNGGALKDGFSVKIIDEDGSLLGPTKAGKLCLKSTVPLLGYLKNEKENKKALLEGGWYDSGDYAFMDSDNLLHIIGRYNYLLRSSGTILVPSFVESIVNSHPSILQSILVGIPSLHNSKDQVGTLFVARASNHQFSKNIEIELRKLLSKELTYEQMEIIRFIRVIPEIPNTQFSGKADRNILKVLAEKLQITSECIQ